MFDAFLVTERAREKGVSISVITIKGKSGLRFAEQPVDKSIVV